MLNVWKVLSVASQILAACSAVMLFPVFWNLEQINGTGLRQVFFSETSCRQTCKTACSCHWRYSPLDAFASKHTISDICWCCQTERSFFWNFRMNKICHLLETHRDTPQFGCSSSEQSFPASRMSIPVSSLGFHSKEKSEKVVHRVWTKWKFWRYVGEECFYHFHPLFRVLMMSVWWLLLQRHGKNRILIYIEDINEHRFILVLSISGEIFFTSEVFPHRRGDIIIVLIPWSKVCRKPFRISVLSVKNVPSTALPNIKGFSVVILLIYL